MSKGAQGKKGTNEPKKKQASGTSTSSSSDESSRPPAPLRARSMQNATGSCGALAASGQRQGNSGSGGGGGEGALVNHKPSSKEIAALKTELDEIDRGLGTCACCAHRISSTKGEDGNTHVKENSELQLQTAKKLRNLLASHREILIHEVLERNWVPRLLEWLELSDLPQVQVEALWALTNIAAGTTEHTHVLLRHNPVPPLVNLLSSSNQEVLEQALWVLGNIAGEGTSARDTVLNNGALKPLVDCIQRHGDNQQILRIGSWAINNLCDHQPRPSLDINVVMPVLKSLVQSEDSEVLSHTCWALSHLCDGPSAHIKAVVEAPICARLVELLKHRSWRVTKPALRTIGNIVCAEDEIDFTQDIIKAGAVPRLRELIAHSNREIQKEACWTLSNIAAGTCEQIQTVLDSGSIPLLVQLARQEGADAEVKSEACWVVLNATSCGSDLQIEYLVNEGGVTVLNDLLHEDNMVQMALEGLERILQVGDEEARRINRANPYAGMLSASKIEELEHHGVTKISKRASRIWKQHFVTCAICSQNFSKHSPDVGFCDECKCFVCVACNCTVFHLDYQEELWKEMSVKEASAKEAQQVSKRNRKARKKQKEKEKKSLQQQAAGNGSGGMKGDDKDAASSDGSEELEGGGDLLPPSSSISSSASRSTAEPSIPIPQPPRSSVPPPQASTTSSSRKPAPSTRSIPPPPPSSSTSSSTATNGASSNSSRRSTASGGGKRSRNGLDSKEDSFTDSPPSPLVNGRHHQQQQQQRKSTGIATIAESSIDHHVHHTNGKDGRSTGASAAGKRGRIRGDEEEEDGVINGDGKAATMTKPSIGGGGGGSRSTSDSLMNSESSLKQSHQPPTADRIDLVDYLQSTGSIIALSRFLDEEGEEGDDHP